MTRGRVADVALLLGTLCAAGLPAQEFADRFTVRSGANRIEMGSLCGELEVLMENSEPVEGFTVAVCHNPGLITLVEVRPGSAVAGGTPGESRVFTGGGYLRLGEGLVPIPPGKGRSIASFRYCCNGLPRCNGGLVATSLELCDGVLGEPGAVNEMVSSGASRTTENGLDLENGQFGCLSECPPPEDCANGIDDDRDGLTDCEQPSCQRDLDCTGLQVPGDCNQDSRLDVSDAICLFGFLFFGDPEVLPCGGNAPGSFSGGVELLDWQPDERLDISDGVALLQFLFGGGPRHARTTAGRETECIRILGCADAPGCRLECVFPPGSCPGSEPADFVARDFLRGDSDGSGTVNIADAVFTLNWLCAGGREPGCLDAADTNDDGCIRLDDAILVCPFPEVEFCQPPPPFPGQGPDLTLDYLDCELPGPP